METILDSLKGRTLQHWLKVAIIRENGSAFVEFRSTIHVKKVFRLSMSWGADFSNADILNDNVVLEKAYQMFGREIFTANYTL